LGDLSHNQKQFAFSVQTSATPLVVRTAPTHLSIKYWIERVCEALDLMRERRLRGVCRTWISGPLKSMTYRSYPVRYVVDAMLVIKCKTPRPDTLPGQDTVMVRKILSISSVPRSRNNRRHSDGRIGLWGPRPVNTTIRPVNQPQQRHHPAAWSSAGTMPFRQWYSAPYEVSSRARCFRRDSNRSLPRLVSRVASARRPFQA